MTDLWRPGVKPRNDARDKVRSTSCRAARRFGARRVLRRPVPISDLAQRHQHRAQVVKTNAPPLQGRQRRDHRLLAQSASTVSAVSAVSVESAAAAERTVHTGVGRTARPGPEERAALAEALRSPGPHQARMRLNQPRPQAHSWRVAASVSSRVSFSYRRRPHRVREINVVAAYRLPTGSGGDICIPAPSHILR